MEGHKQTAKLGSGNTCSFLSRTIVRCHQNGKENETLCHLFCTFIAASGHANANISYFELRHIDVDMP